MDERGGEHDPGSLDAVFSALADGSRRRIIALLRDAGELRVSDLAAAFEMSLNGVSKHIKVLERAGLVRRRVDGRTHWLCVDWSALQVPYAWLHHHHHFWSRRLDALVDYVAVAPGPSTPTTDKRDEDDG